MLAVRFFVVLALVATVSACDLYGPEPGGETPPVVTDPPEEQPRPVEVLSTDSLAVFAVGAPDADNPLIVSEADVQRESIALNVWGKVSVITPCPEGQTCRTRWADYPLVSQTSLRLNVQITVDGEPVAAGANLIPLLNIWERAALITAHDQPTSLFAVVLEPERFEVPAGEIIASMRWGMESGRVLEDAATFEYIPAE